MSDFSSETTSHFAVSAECCQRMADKYSWDLKEVQRRIAARDPLVWECIFWGGAEFPKGPIDYSGGKEQ